MLDDTTTMPLSNLSEEEYRDNYIAAYFFILICLLMIFAILGIIVVVSLKVSGVSTLDTVMIWSLVFLALYLMCMLPATIMLTIKAWLFYQKKVWPLKSSE